MPPSSFQRLLFSVADIVSLTPEILQQFVWTASLPWIPVSFVTGSVFEDVIYSSVQYCSSFQYCRGMVLLCDITSVLTFYLLIDLMLTKHKL